MRALLTARSCSTQCMTMTIIAAARGHIGFVGTMTTAGMADGGGGTAVITAIGTMTMIVGQGTEITTIADIATAKNDC